MHSGVIGVRYSTVYTVHVVSIGSTVMCIVTLGAGCCSLVVLCYIVRWYIPFNWYNVGRSLPLLPIALLYSMTTIPYIVFYSCSNM